MYILVDIKEMFLHGALVEQPDVKILEPKRLEVDGGIEKFAKKIYESYEDSGHVTYAYGILLQSRAVNQNHLQLHFCDAS